MKENIPVAVHNLGSPEGGSLDFTREELYERMDAPLVDLAVRLPVFLVSEAQMDHLYPPERRRFFPERPLRERLRALRERGPGEEGEDPFAPLEDLERGEDLWGGVKEVVAVGLYVREAPERPVKERVLHLGEEGARTGEEEEAYLDHAGPAVYLCPERVVAWADREGVPVPLVQDTVYYHELGHALMDTADFFPDPYQESWGRVVEESLANLVAFRRFRGREAARVARLIRDQPPEYRGYAAAAAFPETFPLFPREVWEEWWWRYRRFPWRLRRVLEEAPWTVYGSSSPGLLGSWRESKRRGLWRDPHVRLFWRAVARMLLEEAVA
ncbi:hypothetical protein [Thermus sp.]|uniref:hypothetical protein n=1 Tax=Thermus sp. TaxID=275 RepID=UPI00321FB426